jgi:hypothetical protein
MPTFNINFVSPASTSRNINFSDDETHLKIDYQHPLVVDVVLQFAPPAQLKIDYVNEVVSETILYNIREVCVDCVFGVNHSTTLEYNNSVWRGVVNETETSWQKGQQTLNEVDTKWKNSLNLSASSKVSWRQGSLAENLINTLWNNGKPLNGVIGSHWSKAISVENAIEDGWNNGKRLNQLLNSHWSKASSVENAIQDGWNNGKRLNQWFIDSWHGSLRITKEYLSKYSKGKALLKQLESPWRSGLNVDSFTFFREVDDPVIPPVVVNHNIYFLCQDDGSRNLYFGRVCSNNVIKTRTFYYMLHSIEVKRILDNKAIRIGSINIKIDQGSFNHDFSFNVLGTESFEALREYSPMLLKVSINNNEWICLVDDPKYARSFAKNSYSVTGVGLIDELNHEKSSVDFDSDMNIIQIAESVLPNDWSLDYLMPDYLVPANSYNFNDKSQIEVLSDIAKSQGGFILPSKTLKQFKMKERIPTYSTPDLSLPSAVILNSSRQLVVGQNYNAVWAMGTNSNGKIAQVKITSSAGDVFPNEPINHALMTNAIGLRQRGQQEILASQDLFRYSLATILSDDVPIIDDLGMRLSVEGENNEDWNGHLTSCEVNASVSDKSVTVRQNLNVDRIL